MSEERIGVLFVCTGNICRSPMAEAVFGHLVRQAGLTQRFDIASRAIGHWHLGQPPHPATAEALRARGLSLPGKRAELVSLEDLDRFRYVVGMTSAHVQDLGTLVGQRAKSTAPQVLLLLDLVPQLDLVDVPDPYYKDNFELVYELIERGCKCLLDHIRAEEGL